MAQDPDTAPLDPLAICPATGETNAECMATICDCFPMEADRFGLHPEYFRAQFPDDTQSPK